MTRYQFMTEYVHNPSIQSPIALSVHTNEKPAGLGAGYLAIDNRPGYLFTLVHSDLYTLLFNVPFTASATVSNPLTPHPFSSVKHHPSFKVTIIELPISLSSSTNATYGNFLILLRLFMMLLSVSTLRYCLAWLIL